jgi:dTDP-4-dehydrorhamnose reductase
METLLVIGAESVVGANLACTLAERFHVAALSSGGGIELEGCVNEECPRDDAELTGLILETAPAWVVYCGPAAQCSWDEISKDRASRLLDEPRRVSAVSAATRQVGCRLTVVSSDAVFTGPRIFHGEAGLTYGSGPLAEASLAVEQALADSPVLVVRTHAYGWSPLPDEISYAEAYWRALDGGILPPVDSYRHATPILASDLAELLAGAYSAGLQGLYHIAGAERTNPRRFAAELASACDVDGWPWQAASEEPSPQPALETSLVCRRIRQALGQPLPMLREGLARFAAQLQNGYRDRLRRAEESVVAQASAA